MADNCVKSDVVKTDVRLKYPPPTPHVCGAGPVMAPSRLQDQTRASPMPECEILNPFHIPDPTIVSDVSS